MPTNPPKKRTRAKSTAKKASAKRTPAKKSAARKNPAKKSAKVASGEGETLQKVARSIGATLGTWAKSTTNAVKAAKQALPGIKKSD